jgi:lipopolysaccharide export system permease protein
MNALIAIFRKFPVVLRLYKKSLKKLDSFVLRSFVGPLILTFFIVLIILILQFLWMYVDELAGKGLEMRILAELLFQFALTFVPMALPLAILLASLMTFGNMGEFSELTALKSAGIPLQRIMRPIIFLVAMLCVVSFFFSNNVLPYSNKKARTLLYDIRRKRPEMNIQAGTFNNDIDGFSIKVTSKDPATNRLDKIIIYDHREKRGNTYVTVADSGNMKVTPDESGMIMTLYNGYSYYEIDEKSVTPAYRKYPFRKDYFKEQTSVISLSGFDFERTNMDLFKSSSVSKNISQLKSFSDSIKKNNSARDNTYFTEFNTTKIYTERNFYVQPEPTADSNKIKIKPVFKTWALLDSIPHVQKIEAITKAIDNVKFTINFLSQKQEYIHSEIKILRQYQVELHRKLTLSFACIVFFLIGAPLGAIIRKGGLGTPAVISILFFVVYYVINISAEKMVKEAVVGTLAGMWASSYILLPVGIFLTYKATTDSSILNIETYLNFFKKIRNLAFRIIFNTRYENTASQQ